jgi:DNA (cytosine-5)-methyltransferase 1
MFFIKKLRVFESFAGIGAVSKALTNLKIDYELVGFSEIDKYSIKSFCAIHGVSESLNYGDINKIDETTLPDFDLYTFGSPCQDFSTAGKKKGAIFTCSDCGEIYNPLLLASNDRNKCPKCHSENIEKTRSSLVMESLRIIKHKKPKYLLMENVKGLVDKNHKPDFLRIVDEIQSYGYKTYWKILNAKDFEIPQNRERVFLIGIREDIEKDFKFPKPIENNIILRDILEDEVEDKYYFKEEIQRRFQFAPKKNFSVIGTTKPKHSTSFGQRYLVYNPNSYIGALTATDYKQPKQIIVPKKEILRIANVTRSGYSTGNVHHINGISPTIMDYHGVGVRILDMNNFLVRKLTPKETFRCMGFSDEDYLRVKNLGTSDTQMYKQTGNSIVVNVLMAIFTQLLL